MALKTAAQKGASNLEEIPLDFSDKEAMLGSYGECLNYSATTGDCSITFAYKVHSLYLSQDCTVKWVFDRNFSTENGQASRLQILSDDGLFELVFDILPGSLVLSKCNRLGAESAFFRTYNGLGRIYSVENPSLSAEAPIEEKDYIIAPDSIKSEMTKEQLNDLYELFLKLENSGSFAKCCDTQSLVIRFKDFYHLPVVKSLCSLSKEKMFEELYKHSAEDTWRAEVEAMEKDYHAENIKDYFQEKMQAWLSEVTIPIFYPMEDDFFKTMERIMHPCVFGGNLVHYSTHSENVFPLPALIKVLCGMSDSEYSRDYIQLIERFEEFCFNVIEEVFYPSFVGSTYYISSSRATVRRIYTENLQDNSFDVLLQQYDYDDKTIIYSNGYSLGDFTNRWLRKFGVGEGLSIENKADKERIIPYVLKDGRIVHLADLGYGVTQLFSILLNIDVAICHAGLDDHFYPEHFCTFKPSYIIIEEPEIHLHPRLQSLLADMFLEAYLKYNIHFIIETHSEYLIRKYQYLVAEHSMSSEAGVDPSDICIYYLYDADPAKRPEGQQQVQEIRLRPDGILDTPFGKGFFDEADSISSKIWIMKFASHAE